MKGRKLRSRAEVYLKAEFAQALYPDPKESALALEIADTLRLTLTRQFDGDAAPVVVYDGRLSGKADSAYTGQQATMGDQFLLGALAAGSTGNLIITVSAPGATMGNKFMGKSAKVNWLFRAQADEGGTPPLASGDFVTIVNERLPLSELPKTGGCAAGDKP